MVEDTMISMFQPRQDTVQAPSFADLTTMGVGGQIESFLCPTDRVGLIEAVEGADAQGQPLCVIGGGSNILAADEAFSGLVVRDARREINVLDEAAPVEGQDRSVHVAATAGTHWDDLVNYCVRMGLSGIEGLSGIPGTVGASVVQNIGAYGQEVAQSVDTVEVWDRQLKVVQELNARQMSFGYRTSALKATMYRAPGVPGVEFFPTPRYIVLSVTLVLRHSHTSRVDSDQLAQALQVETGNMMPIEQIRDAVLSIRARKGMLEDPGRYQLPWMKGTRETSNIQAATEALHMSVIQQSGGTTECDIRTNRHSCGSFFMNPVLDQKKAAQLPPQAPQYQVLYQGRPSGTVKTSAAWLIDHAGFHKGFHLENSMAALSSVHTLALTNRGGATAQQIYDLARTIQDGVEQAFGIRIIPEPVLIAQR